MRTTITTHVNGHWEMLEACASLASYSEEYNLYVDKLSIQLAGEDDWTIRCELIPLSTQDFQFDHLPF